MVHLITDLPVNLGECLQLEERSAVPRRQARPSWPRRHVRRQASGRRGGRVLRGRDVLAHVISPVIFSDVFRSATADPWVRRHWLPNALFSLPLHTLPS